MCWNCWINRSNPFHADLLQMCLYLRHLFHLSDGFITAVSVLFTLKHALKTVFVFHLYSDNFFKTLEGERLVMKRHKGPFIFTRVTLTYKCFSNCLSSNLLHKALFLHWLCNVSYMLTPKLRDYTGEPTGFRGPFQDV